MADEQGELGVLPVAVWTGTVTLMGEPLTFHVLDDGMRIIEAESLERFMKALASGPAPTTEEIGEFIGFMHARGLPASDASRAPQDRETR